MNTQQKSKSKRKSKVNFSQVEKPVSLQEEAPPAVSSRKRSLFAAPQKFDIKSKKIAFEVEKPAPSQTKLINDIIIGYKDLKSNEKVQKHVLKVLNDIKENL